MELSYNDQPDRDEARTCDCCGEALAPALAELDAAVERACLELIDLFESHDYEQFSFEQWTGCLRRGFESLTDALLFGREDEDPPGHFAEEDEDEDAGGYFTDFGDPQKIG